MNRKARMSPCTLRLMSLPKGNAKRVHFFLDIEDQKSSMETVQSPACLSNPSAQWLTSSLDIILSAYSNIQPLANYNSNSISNWVNDGLEDTVKLLDMCNTISDNIAEVKRYETLLQTAIHSLDHAGLDFRDISQIPLLIRATNILADCRACIINVNTKCNTTASRSRAVVSIEDAIACSRISRLQRDLSKDMFDLKDCTASLLKTVAKALSIELPRASLHGHGDSLVIPRHCSRLRSLFERVRNHNKGHYASRFLLHELESADVLVRKLYDILSAEKPKDRKEHVKMKDLVEELKRCGVELDNGISVMESKIKELYSALIRTRMALLDILTYSL